jgi:hypothetical protein
MALAATATTVLSSKAFGTVLPTWSSTASARSGQSAAAPLRIRCNAEPQDAATPATPTPAPAKPKVSKKGFGDVMAFSGPGPETINGRLAMLGFTSAIGVELANHHQLATQIADPASLTWFATTVALFSAASLIPMFKGVSTEEKSKAFWSSTAEMWNGRAAMLGLSLLALTEYLKGASLV